MSRWSCNRRRPTGSTRNPTRVTGRKAGGAPYTVTIPEFGAAALREQRALVIPFDPVFPARRGTR